MINEPPIDLLTSKLGDEFSGSKFALCVVTSKRARQLMEIVKNSSNPAILNDQKPLTAAAFEVADGKISVSNT